MYASAARKSESRNVRANPCASGPASRAHVRHDRDERADHDDHHDELDEREAVGLPFLGCHGSVAVLGPNGPGGVTPPGPDSVRT